MSDFSNARAVIQYSELSDFSTTLIDIDIQQDTTPDEYLATTVDAVFAGTIIDLANFTTVSDVVVVNNGSFAVNMTFSDPDTADSVVIGIDPGNWAKVCGMTIGTDLVLACQVSGQLSSCDVLIEGT